MDIRRLTRKHAPEIVDCFHRVYGDTYANELFYDEIMIAERMQSARLYSVGAFNEEGRLVGHMAMQAQVNAQFAELGNTIIDPIARGAGLAWQVGEELTNWCTELGYPAYLHYPTTDHHIMQRQSVTSGFETGLMLGYIPARTDAKVGQGKRSLRGAATIVVNPLSPCPPRQVYCSSELTPLLQSFAAASGVPRSFQTCNQSPAQGPTQWLEEHHAKRELRRLRVQTIGDSFGQAIVDWLAKPAECYHLDLEMDDASLEYGVGQARELGFLFCGWLPGYTHTDVLRLQRFNHQTTDLQPDVVNATAQDLLAQCRLEVSSLTQ